MTSTNSIQVAANDWNLVFARQVFWFYTSQGFALINNLPSVFA